MSLYSEYRYMSLYGHIFFFFPAPEDQDEGTWHRTNARPPPLALRGGAVTWDFQVKVTCLWSSGLSKEGHWGRGWSGLGRGGERIVGLGFGRRALCVSGSSAGVVVEGCPWWPWNPGVQASGKGGDRRRSQAGGVLGRGWGKARGL